MERFPALMAVLDQIETVLVWGLVATVVLTVVMYGSQALGFSRLSLPFLVGSCLIPTPADQIGATRSGHQ
jgi:hypothetical protein